VVSACLPRQAILVRSLRGSVEATHTQNKTELGWTLYSSVLRYIFVSSVSRDPENAIPILIDYNYLVCAITMDNKR